MNIKKRGKMSDIVQVILSICVIGMAIMLIINVQRYEVLFPVVYGITMALCTMHAVQRFQDRRRKWHTISGVISIAAAVLFLALMLFALWILGEKWL